MPKQKRRYSALRIIMIVLISLILLAGIAFQVFINRYLPPLVRQRLTDIVVKGSDSLYKLDVGNFDVSFWGASVRATELHISIDSARYKKLEAEKRLPPLTFSLDLKKGSIVGISIRKLLFSKKADIDRISFDQADIKLSRHFRSAEETERPDEPLWKLIRPDLSSIHVDVVSCANVNMTYQNIDSARNFHWKFDKLSARLNDIRVDSVSAREPDRLLFSKDIALSVNNISMKTPDGLYNLRAENINYSSAARMMEAKEFSFQPAISERDFIRHFGFQHEIYKLKMPVIRAKNFLLPQWINYNRLAIDTIEFASPDISVSMNRDAPLNPHSKKGMYPHQLIQRAPFAIAVKRLTVSDGTVVYTETNDVTAMTGKLVFPRVHGYIDNITNELKAIDRSNQCVADVHSGVLKTGLLHAIFRFNLTDKAGAFRVNATISNLDAQQLQPLAKAMTATDLQSFNMHRLDYIISGNENTGTGNLRMRYDEMDILLNRVEADKSFKKRGFLSFLANRLVVYKDNPHEDEEERTAENVVVTRDDTKSFFNFIWKTLFTSAGKIVLRPMVLRKIEKRKEREKEKNR